MPLYASGTSAALASFSEVEHGVETLAVSESERRTRSAGSTRDLAFEGSRQR